MSISIVCPDWCTDPAAHDFGTESVTGRPVLDHVGPEFGPFYVEGKTYLDQPNQEVAPPVIYGVECEIDGRPHTVADLRKIAADATAAADWLEVNR